LVAEGRRRTVRSSGRTPHAPGVADLYACSGPEIVKSVEAIASVA
jgi:hypothetical protein